MALDVVVVGAGPAGCLVTRRLFDAGHSVRLLEAGNCEQPAFISSPDWLGPLAKPEWNWGQLEAVGFVGAPAARYLRGRGVGGSSAINAMVATIGPRSDYSAWPVADVMPALARVQADNPTRTVPPGPLSAKLSSAAGLCGSWQAKLAPLAVTKDGRRRSASHYLNPLPSQVLQANSEVWCLQADKADPTRITGVVLSDGRTVSADHTILCAGAVMSPVIMLRSGSVDLAGVGARAMDHPSVAISVELPREFRIAHAQAVPAISTVISSPRSGEGGGSADEFSADEFSADEFSADEFSADEFSADEFSADEFSADEFSADEFNADAFSGMEFMVMDHTGSDPAGRSVGAVLVALLDPVSEGAVTLTADGQAAINLNMLSEQTDVVRLGQAVAQASSLVSECLGPAALIEPPPSDPEALKRWVWKHPGPYSHISASCRMASEGRAVTTGEGVVDGSGVANGEGVVDGSGVVIGRSGLSIIDASILPSLPRTNPMMPTLVMAEAAIGAWLGVTTPEEVTREH